MPMRLISSPRGTSLCKEELVAVLIPVSGNPIFLRETLVSVQQQTYQNLEILIVLNNCEHWVKEFVEVQRENDSRIEIIETSLVGISNALNLGVSASKGELICRIDSDDIMRTDRIQKQKYFLERHPKVVCVGSQVNKIDRNGKFLGISKYPNSPRQVGTNLMIRNCIAHPSVMYRRSSILEIGGYRSNFNGAEDYDLWLRLSCSGPIRNLNTRLTSYRIWENQVTAGKKHLISAAASRARESLYSAQSNPPFLSRSEMKNWVTSADHFNAGLFNLRTRGSMKNGMRRIYQSFRLTPKLVTRVCFNYLLNYFLGSIRGLRRES